MSKEKALYELFLLLFSDEGLRRFLTFNTTRKVVQSLPAPPAAAIAVAAAAVAELAQQGLIDAALFERMREEIPGRRADITAVERRWLTTLEDGCEPAAAGPRARGLAPVNVLIAHARDDKSYCDELEKHLASLREQGVLRLWHPGMMPPGTTREVELKRRLDEAGLILPLISADFLTSDWEKTLREALGQQKSGKVKIVPVYIRPCAWQGTRLGSLAGVPISEKPISTWTHRDLAWVEVVETIGAICQS